MKPFSKFEAINGKPVVCRNGEKVEEIFELKADIGQPVVALVEGESQVKTFTSDGHFFENKEESVYDLFMAPAVVEGWVAFGPETDQSMYGLLAFATYVWATEADAIRSYRIANHDHEPKGTVRISWEE